MIAQYTPGPWTVSGRQVKSIDHGKRYTVATTNNPKFTDEANASNAWLIAAAPDLLTALRIAEDALDIYSGGQSSDLAAIRAAIDKAMGAA